MDEYCSCSCAVLSDSYKKPRRTKKQIAADRKEIESLKKILLKKARLIAKQSWKSLSADYLSRMIDPDDYY